MPILPQSKPKISDNDTDKIVSYYFEAPPKLLIVGIRGYYSRTFGKEGNDYNVWDDAFLVYENGTLLETFNGNTDPSKLLARKARLKPGIYTFYKGVHRNRIRGLRAYPEGIRWHCERQSIDGKWYDDLCGYINFHDPTGSGTGSEGCQTIPQPQFNEFRDLVYALMTKHKLKVVTYLLLDEPQMKKILS